MDGLPIREGDVGLQQESSGFDLIGDVHGCANTLVRLLKKLGYRQCDGVFRHPQRKAIFLGDIVDRGPRIREALHIVKNMVDAGEARMVMGNHEYNAICYCTHTDKGPGKQPLREHNARHERMIRETLAQFALYQHEWETFLQWFMTLPLFIEETHFRVVHACWDDALIRRFAERCPNGVMDHDFLLRSVTPGSFEFDVAERLMRGTDLRLPDGRFISSRDGVHRRFFRTSYWLDNPQTYGEVLFQPDPLPEDIAVMPISSYDRARLLYYGAEHPPLFIGHYWREGHPAPLTNNIACLDYSAVKYGKLVAYRMDTEHRIHPGKFVWVDVKPNDTELQEVPISL
ncbi:metallophosphoesterase [Pokkaliibacter sp. MBI-7]|uniref:metallophosphoesterase n=1 Tax=Pokkaliibacter sp. MBI-7 TaxID=3040600 RepID=UPI00244B945B|nr:metallophosphoesterase [Pokkaliibacter sp. MBI-7]MDH2435129.1 metallophosphoesterase [Pokkaliibacter sp. MBI-7]